MSNVIDNRVVKMTFDNAQFEEGVRQTMEILSKFEKSLSFENAGQGFESLNKAADKVDLTTLSEKAAKEVGKIDQYSAEAATSLGKIDDSVQNADFSPLSKSAINAANDIGEAINHISFDHITNSIQNVNESFNAMEQIAIGALRKIGGEAIDEVKGKLLGLKDAIINPIKEGFGEYETQIGAIQTIIANTGMSFDSDRDIDLVNTKLDELNEYADKTIYKFTDMVNAIGRFTASGLDIDQATQSVQGVANVAALAGASMQDVSRVLPQIAQALSAGTVSMQDWFSVETANMNSKIFVDTIADVAMHMAEVGKAEQKSYEAGQAILEQGMTMRAALNKTDNKDWAGWFTSDILSNALQLFTYDWETMTAEQMEEARKFLAEIGYTTEEEVTAVFEKASMAQRAAQEVRTWSQLLDTLGESIGSNWTMIWRNLLGDFKQATDTFTLLSDNMTKGIDALFGGIVHASEIFSNSGDDDIASGIELIFGKAVVELDEKTEELRKTGDRIPGALDYIVEAVQKPLEAIGSAFHEVFKADDETIALAIENVANGIKNFAESLVISDSAAQSLKDIFQGLFSIVDLALQAIVIAAQGIAAAIEAVRVVTDPLTDITLALWAQIGKFLTWAHDKVVEIAQAIGEALAPVGEFGKVVGEVITEFFKWADIPDKINSLGDALIAVLDILWKFIDIPGKIRLIGDVFSDIAGTIGDITGWNAAVAESDAIFKETGEHVSALDIWIKHLLENPIVSFFAGIVSALAQPIISIKDFIAGLLEVDDATSKSKVPKFWDELKDKADDLLKPISKLVDAFKNFGSALGTFAGKVATAITKFEPFVKFKESITSFFTELPGKVGAIGSSIGTEISKIQNPIDIFANWLNGKADYLRNVTVEQFVKDVQTSVSGTITEISKLVESVKNMTPESFFSGWKTATSEFVQNNDNFTKSIMNIAQTIEEQFPSTGGVFTGAITGIKDGIVNGINGITEFLDPIIEKSETMPDLFINIFTAIKDGIVGKIGEIKQEVENFKPEDFINAFDGLKDKFTDVLEKIFPDLATKVSDVMTKFSDFFTKVTEGANTWGEAFDKIVTAVKEKVSKLPETFTEVFNKIGSGLSTALAFITAQLGKLPGGIGEFFRGLSENFQAIGDVDLDNESLKDSLLAYSDMADLDLEDKLTKGLNENLDIVGIIKNWVDDQVEKLPGILDNFLQWARELFEGTTLDDIVKAVEGLAIAKLILSMKSIIKAIAGGIEEITGGIGELIKGTAKSVTGIGTSVGGVIKSFGSVEESIAYAIKQQNKRDVFGEFAEAMKNIAIAMAVVGVTLYVISKIENVQEAIMVLGEMAGIVFALEFLSGLVTKFLAKEAGNQLLAAAKSLGVLAVDMIAAMGAIALLNQFDWEANKVGLEAGVAMLAVFGLFLIAVTKFGGEGGKFAVEASVAIAVLVAGLNLLLPAIQSLSEYVYGKIEGLEGEQLAKEIGALIAAFAGIIVVMLAMAKTLNLAGEHGISAGIGFMLVAQGVTMLVDPVTQLAKLPLDHLGESLFTIVALLGIYAGLAANTSALDLVGTSIGIIAYAESIKLLGDAIKPLAEYDLTNLVAAAGSIGILLLAFELLVTTTGTVDLVATSVGIVIFGAAVIELAGGLKVLAEMDSEPLIRAAEAIFIVVGALTVLTAWSGAADVLVSSAAMVIFGASVLEMSAGLSILAQLDSESLIRSAEAIFIVVGALTLLSGWTGAVDVLASSAAMVIFGASIIELAAGLTILAESDSDAIIKSAEAIFIVVGALTVLTAWSNAVDLLASSAAMLLYADALVYISNAIEQLASMNWESVKNASLVLGGFVAVFALFSGLTSELDLITTALALDMFAVALIGVAYAINMLPDPETLHGIGYNIFAGIGEGIAAGAKAVVQGVIDCAGMIFHAILSFFGIESPSTLMRDEVGQYIPAGIAEGITGNSDLLNTALDGLGEGVLSWVETDGVGMLGNATGSIADWLATDGSKNINKSLTGLGDGVISWISSDGLTKLAEAAKALTDWLTTDGINVIIDFGKYAIEKLNELKDRFFIWMQTDGIPMLDQAGKDLWNWIITDGVKYFMQFLGWAGERLGEAASKFAAWMQSDGLPALGKAASDIWNWICTDGVDLFLKFVGWLGEKAADLASMFGNWILNDAIPFVGEKLGELGKAILDWFGGIPESISKKIDEMMPDWGSIGDNIVKGISEGITGGLSWITNAINDLGDNTIGAALRKFEINSPSKVMRDEVGINLVAGIAEGLESSDAHQIMRYSWDSLLSTVNGLIPGFMNNDGVKSKIREDVNGLLDAIRTDATIDEVIESVGKYFPEKIANSILQSPAFYVKDATPGYVDELYDILSVLAEAGLTTVDEVALESEGKLDPILKEAFNYTNASVNNYLDETGQIITSDFKLKFKETATDITNEVTNDPEIKNVGNNLLKGIIEGIDLSEAEVTIYGARDRLATIIKEALPGFIDNEEVKQNIRNEVNGLDSALRQDATLTDIINKVGEYFPENIASAILKSPAFYVQNGTSDYLNELRNTVERLAAEGYSVIDETMAADQGQLDNLMYAALEYTNITMSNYLENVGQTINENFEIQTQAMADGAYKAGWTIPEAFTAAISEGFGITSELDLVKGAIQSTGASYAYGYDRVQEATGKLFNTDGQWSWMDNAADILKLAAEYLPKTFADEFQKHADENVPVLRRTLSALLNSTLPMLDDQGAEYVTSVHSASEIVNNALQFGFFSSIAECINNNNSTLEELSKAIGMSFPENIANGILEHSNLPVTQIAQIADLIYLAMEAAVDNDSPKYVDTLTGAYSYIVDSFYYEIDNAKDVQELGEIIGRYFPEGMGTGIVENRDVPMSEMIENLKWMAANGQLEIPGFQQTGEQLGLALSDGVVVGLFQDTGWTDNTNGYMTEYANNIRDNTETFHAAGGHIGMSIDTGSIQAWTDGQFTQEVLNGVADISNLATVPAVETGTAIGTSVGESVVSGAETGLDGMDGTITDSVTASGSEAEGTAKETGELLGKAIIDGMNEQLNNEDSGLIKAIKTVGDDIISKSEALGKAIASALIDGIEEGFGGDGEDSLIGKVTTGTKNVFSLLAGTTGKSSGNSTSGLLKKDDLEVLKSYEFQSKIVNVEKDSKTVLNELLTGALSGSVNLMATANKTNMDSATMTAAGFAAEQNKTNFESSINTGFSGNKQNIQDILSAERYSDTLSRIDANLYTMQTKQDDIYNDFLREITDIKSKQEDLYNIVNDTTNDYLSSIENNVNKDMDIYMDTGALVGAIASDMDDALGYRQILSSRGA